MFLTTGDVNRSYAIKGIVNATAKLILEADEIDRVDDFDSLYDDVRAELAERAINKGGDGIIDIHFEPQTVRVTIAPRFLVLHGYGTVIEFSK